MGMLNEDEKMQAIMAAYKQLSEVERAEIDGLVNLLRANIKAKRSITNFGFISALELLGKLGLFLLSKEQSCSKRFLR